MIILRYWVFPFQEYYLCTCKLLLFLPLNVAHFIPTCTIAFPCYYNWDHLPGILTSDYLWHKRRVWIFMYFSCFWPSCGSKLLLGLLILKVDSFGWWSLSELTVFVLFLIHVSLYIVGSYIQRVVWRKWILTLSMLFTFFLLYRSQQMIIIKKPKTNPQNSWKTLCHISICWSF